VRIKRKVGAAVAIVGSVLVVASGAVPALAGSHGPASLRLAGTRFADAANGTSTTFGGWVFTQKAAKSVTTQYKVPTLKCTKAASGVGPIAVMVTGTKAAPVFNAAGLLLECSTAGAASATAAVVVDGAATASTKPVAAGDLIQATVTTSTTTTTVTVADLTKGHTFKLTKSGKGAAAVQEQIIDDSLASGTTQLPVANFGTIGFTSAAINGKAIGTVTSGMGVNMVSAKKVLQILTGPVTGTKKNAFTTTFKHA
jgi:hypothetical protein